MNKKNIRKNNNNKTLRNSKRELNKQKKGNYLTNEMVVATPKESQVGCSSPRASACQSEQQLRDRGQEEHAHKWEDDEGASASLG